MPLEYLDQIMETGRVRIPFDEGNNQIKLTESDSTSDIKEILIDGFDSKCFAFRLDGLKKSTRTHLYLKKGAVEIHKGCDGILIFRFEGKGIILVCEIKSKHPAGFKKQMKSSNAFIDYLCALLKRFRDIDLWSFERINVLFTTRPFANKEPLGTQKRKQNGDEDIIFIFCNPSKSKIPHFHVKRFIGN
jgi:hypothetical protein